MFGIYYHKTGTAHCQNAIKIGKKPPKPVIKVNQDIRWLLFREYGEPEAAYPARSTDLTHFSQRRSPDQVWLQESLSIDTHKTGKSHMADTQTLGLWSAANVTSPEKDQQARSSQSTAGPSQPSQAMTPVQQHSLGGLRDTPYLGGSGGEELLPLLAMVL